MKQINQLQRYQIEAYMKSGKSKSFIATELAVHISSIYRELKRNVKKRGKYNAQFAQTLCDERKERLNLHRTFTPEIQKFVKDEIMQQQWSPKQIIGHCKKNNLPCVSHERIYQFIRNDKLNGGNLYKYLRHKLKHRKRPVSGKHPPIKDRVLIDLRPDIINKKLRFGDWEIDTIIGKDRKEAIVTIVERTTAFLLMKKLDMGKNADALANVVIDLLLPYKKFVHSITSDNGKEFAEHKKIAGKLNLEFFFAHPYSSWERGLSEYTNRLVRQYIPKKLDFITFSHKQIADIQYKINNRPRENLEFENPKTIFFNLVR